MFHFTRIDCLYENFKQYLNNGDDFIPQDFDLREQEKLNVAVNIVRNFFKDAFNVSHSNFVHNTNNLISTLPQASNDISRVGSTKKRLDSDKFQLSY